MFEFIYRVRDPWDMASPQERFRFEETTRLLLRSIAPETRVGSILEIGCAEGHHTEHLARLCERLTAIDISSTAVERARRRVPTAEFAVGDLLAQSWADEEGRFDVVTACEVLYYFTDAAAVLRAMGRLGRRCFVTYHDPVAHLIERHLAPIAGVERATIRTGNMVWHAAWWSGQAPRECAAAGVPAPNDS